MLTDVFNFLIDFILECITFAFNLSITSNITLGWLLIGCCLIGLLLRIIFHSFGGGGK